MRLFTAYATKNDCYKKAQKMSHGKPVGVVVHSTGKNNPNLKRYVYAPVEVGKNIYGNHWNRAGVNKCVHAFIGYDKNKAVAVANILPYDVCCWGCGKGAKGSYNYNPAYVQFEICEDGLKDGVYFNAAFTAAIEYCAYLCKRFDIPVTKIVSHKEAHKKGYASNHGDVDHWLAKFGKDMAWFRKQVKNLIETPEAKPEPVVNYQCVHTVASGDSYWNLAKKYLGKGTRYKEIMTLNGTTSTKLVVGQQIKIPYK